MFHSTEDNICYTSNSDMVCCYVKSKEEVKKTGGENLTSTKKKISFVIDNKKYERIIYIENIINNYNYDMFDTIYNYKIVITMKYMFNQYKY